MDAFNATGKHIVEKRIFAPSEYTLQLSLFPTDNAANVVATRTTPIVSFWILLGFKAYKRIYQQLNFARVEDASEEENANFHGGTPSKLCKATKGQDRYTTTTAK